MLRRLFLLVQVSVIINLFAYDSLLWKRAKDNLQTPHCQIKTEEELAPLNCEKSRSLGGTPFAIVSSYSNFNYENWLNTSYQDWNKGELQYPKAFSQICRTLQKPLNALTTAKCEARLIPRGSVVSIIRVEEKSSSTEETKFLVRVVSVSKKYAGLSLETQKKIILPGDFGYISESFIKLSNPSTLFLISKSEKLKASAFIADFNENGFAYQKCGDDFYLGFHELNTKKYELTDKESKKYINADCSFKENNLELAPKVESAYKLLGLINKTFKSDPYDVFDLTWTEEGLVAFPYSQNPYEVEEDKISEALERFKDVAFLEGFGPENRYVTFNENGNGERFKRIDRWVRPRAMCSFFVLMQKWEDLCSHTHSFPYCAIQVNDFSFHSPAINPLTINPRGISKDVLQHHTHNSARCIDLRLFSPSRFTSRMDDSAESKKMTNEFLALAHDLGAIDIFYAWPNENTKTFIRKKAGHTNHVHFCFPTKKERENAYYQSINTLTPDEDKASVEIVRLRDKEDTSKFYENCPALPLVQAPETDACYNENIDL